MSTDAREKARQIAAQQAKKSPSQASRRWLQLGVLAVVLVIVGIIGFVVINGNKNTKVAESGPVPSSANEYGGIVLTKDGIVQNSSTQETRDFKQLATSTSSVTPMVNGTVAAVNTLPPGVQTAEEASKNGQPVRVTIFQDYNCVHCAEFEKKYGEEIQKLVEDGTITELKGIGTSTAGVIEQAVRGVPCRSTTACHAPDRTSRGTASGSRCARSRCPAGRPRRRCSRRARR